MQQQQNPYDISAIFPSANLKGDDLLTSGPIVVEVESVELKTFQKSDGGSETKPQVTFTSGQRMTCNPTQGRAIAKIVGNGDIRYWAGAQLMLMGIPTQLGKATIGVSVPMKLPNAPAQNTPRPTPAAGGAPPRRPSAPATVAAPDWPDSDYDDSDVPAEQSDVPF